MPRFNASEIDNYGGNGGGGFFSLKNDGDVARVRIMWNGIDDIAGYAVHEVTIGGRKRYVNCLREYDQPLDDCPCCRNRMYQTVKLYIPIYDIDEDKVKYWERGKKFMSKLTSLCARYSSDKIPLVAQVFEIERNGKQGDTNTTYEIYPVGQPDGTTLDDLPEVLPVIGNLILDKSADELEYYLQTGEFPDAEEKEPVRKREKYTETTTRNERTLRRTPAKRVDRF